MELVFILLSGFIITCTCIIALEKKKKRQLIKIRNQWGLPKSEYFDFELIEIYLNANKLPCFHKLTEQTIKDIDLYELFTFIDRTNSSPGQQYLFDRLIKPINDINELKLLNTQVTFFKNNQTTREKIQLHLKKLSIKDSYSIAGLLNQNNFQTPGWLKWLTINLLVALGTLIAFFFYKQAIVAIMLVFAIHLFLHFKNKNKASLYIRSFPELIKLIRITEELVKENIPFDKNNPSKSVKNLSSFRNRFLIMSFGQTNGDDWSLVVFYFIELIKAFFLIEIISFYGIVKCLEDKQKDVQCLLEFVGRIDACISIASLRSGSNNTCEPEFSINEKALDLKAIYHPLIKNCVANSFSIQGKSVLITGSNMSGKSSFLRTIAINSVLAQSIYTCFAEAYSAPMVMLGTSILVEDNLFEGKSYYFSEVEIMADLLNKAIQANQNLFILDEVFKGTNTVERIAAGKAILSYLNQNKNLVMVSSHDIELEELLKDEYDLYHFEEEIQNNQLVFDHLLKKGPLQSRNAIKILELKKYPSSVVKEASNLSFRLFHEQNKKLI